MSSSSVVGQVSQGHGFGGRFGQDAFGNSNTVGGMFGNALTGGSLSHTLLSQGYDSMTAGIGSPGTPPPAPNSQDATMTALNQQLNNEVRMRASNTLATGGTGLSQAPSTAGTMLLGGN